MPDRPLILFPSHESSERARGYGGKTKFSTPTLNRQMDRMGPKFKQLQRSIKLKTISIQESSTGINPECALVLEVIGNVNNFYASVKRIEGLEWLFDISIDEIENDEDFSLLDNKGNPKDGNLSGKVYCVMTNNRALEELISLWKNYVDNPDMEFRRGYTSLRDMFKQLKDIRYWSPQDRVEETKVLEYWEETLEIDGKEKVNFEIELFFRKSNGKRKNSSLNIRKVISDMGGNILSETIISEIEYHGLLASLPRNQIKLILEDYEDVALTKVDDIMFLRPLGQVAFSADIETEGFHNTDEQVSNTSHIKEEPIVAIFDGLPMQNHELLRDRLIIDDPDEMEKYYTVPDRIHGTAMTSLIIHSDLNNNNSAITRKLYVRPIFRPYRDFNNKIIEQVPEDTLLVDLIHVAIRRLFEDQGEIAAVAPTIKVINLSLGDPTRQFVNSMSPLARLLDWLSYKYKVLFIVSAGNHNLDGIDINMSFTEIQQLNIEEREKLIIESLEQNSRNMRLLSPSESINSLTVGALFKDYSEVEENERMIFPVEDILPSPVSAIGLGYNRSIKPDIFFNGGRKLMKKNYFSTNLDWVTLLTKPPGSCVATPGTGDENSSLAYTFGTSDATAQITHEASRCYKILEDIFLNQMNTDIPKDYVAVLIKSMLVHGASWDKGASVIADSLDVSEKRVQKWLGNGIPDISKVMQCAQNRITLIGYGTLEKDKAHVYFLPIPFDFSSGRYFRRLTVTLSYFSPITVSRQRYRSAQLWFTLDNNKLTPNRVNTDHNAVKRGTIQHEIFTGKKALAWDPSNNIKIKINCKDDADKNFSSVDYGLMVSFEIAEEVCDRFDIDVYTNVITKIRETLQVPASRG